MQCLCTQPFQPVPTKVPTLLAGWLSNPSTMTRPAVSGGLLGLDGSTNPGNSVVSVIFVDFWILPKHVECCVYNKLLWFFVPAAILKRALSPPANNPAVDYPLADSEHVSKRAKHIGISNGVHFISFHIAHVYYDAFGQLSIEVFINCISTMFCFYHHPLTLAIFCR